MLSRHDLRRTDINVLVIFEAMMHERNVSRVGEKLFLGQPAVSSALARLREKFDDPLFVRNGRYMEPTPRAEELYETLTPMLDTIAITLSSVADFDPAKSSSTFNIGLSDDVELGLLPRFIRQVRSEAPRIRLVVHRTDCSHVSSLLASGSVSIGICHTSTLPARAKRKVLRMIRPVVLRADGNEGSLSLDEFCRRPHATVSSMGNLTTEVDRVLEQLGRQRFTALEVPQFSALTALLAGSDLLAVVPEYVALAMESYAGLRAEDLPVHVTPFELAMAWRATADSDPAERWLRLRLGELLGESSQIKLSIVAA